MKDSTKNKIGKANAGEKNGRYKHGYSGSPLHKRWIRIRYRAKTRPGYEHINVCKRWNNYENFLEDMGDTFQAHVRKHGEDNTSIDRIDNNKGYEPNNCRWATCKQQSNNRKKTIYFGNKTLSALAEENGLSYGLVYKRLMRGWPVERAIKEKPHVKRK